MIYGKFGKEKSQQGQIHDYLGMKLDFRKEGKVIIHMCDYIKDMIRSFPEDLKNATAPTPADDNLFGQGQETATLLNKKQAEIFHTIVGKGLFVAKSKARHSDSYCLPMHKSFKTY